MAAVALSCATATRQPPRGGGTPSTDPFAVVLGIAQDGGYPQAGCNRPDCIDAWNNPRLRRHVASLGIVDPATGERWMIDATPDFPAQLRMLDEATNTPVILSRRSRGGREGAAAEHGEGPPVEGTAVRVDSAQPKVSSSAQHPNTAALSPPAILLTHAHIGHYLGLAQLGREVMGTHGVPVYAMPRMRDFLAKNGPWDQLVRLGNIDLRPLEDGRELRLGEHLTVTPLVVPHRDEYSETVAFIVRGPTRSILWLPDIDKWERWSTPIESVLDRVDVAYVDGTFHDASELPGRDLREIPHPLMIETMQRLARYAQKITFIHLNQSNPALRDPSVVSKNGFRVAAEGERIGL